MNRNKEVILDLIRACQMIREFCKNINKNNFLEDEKTQSSVLYQIIIIGESVNKFDSDFMASHPQIPFNAIKGMRNRVVHEYKEVDLDILWEVIQSNIPKLLCQFEMIYNQENDY